MNWLDQQLTSLGGTVTAAGSLAAKIRATNLSLAPAGPGPMGNTPAYQPQTYMPAAPQAKPSMVPAQAGLTGWLNRNGTMLMIAGGAIIAIIIGSMLMGRRR